MKILFTLLFAFLGYAAAIAQTQAPLHYIFRVYLKDKGAVNYTVEKPLEFLSQAAIDRKKRQHAAIDSSDFPISPDYFRQIEQYNGTVVAFSKWFKTMAVRLSDSLSVAGIASLPFVDSVKYVWRGRADANLPEVRPRLEMPGCDQLIPSGNLPGVSKEEFDLHNARPMAEAGFRGKGIRIAVIDAGFTNVDVIPYFGRTDIAGWRNFVPSGSLFSASDHGTKVLSAMAVNQPGIMLGSAPQASYLMLRSEDVASEFPVEEDYWARAIEYADSLGVDLVNTSLGYNSFDDKSLDYKPHQMTGRVSLMSLAANRAFGKGMIVICSAGNEGAKNWGKITSPGDAENVLTIGAVGADSVIARFSSMGPTADLRIKPDLVSFGRETSSIGKDGLLSSANGTSLSAPFLAGLVASAWSINPGLDRARVMDIVKRSADRYSHPDTIYGYGIPDFQKVMKAMLFSLPEHRRQVADSVCVISPEKEDWLVRLKNPELSPSLYTVKIIDETGRVASSAKFEGQNELRLALPKEWGGNGRPLFFILQNPLWQKTYRVNP